MARCEDPGEHSLPGTTLAFSVYREWPDLLSADHESRNVCFLTVILLSLLPASSVNGNNHELRAANTRDQGSGNCQPCRASNDL